MENIVPNNSSIVSCVSLAAETCLVGPFLAMDVSSDSTIPAFRRYVIMYFYGVERKHRDNFKFSFMSLLVYWLRRCTKEKAAVSSGMAVTSYRTIWRYNPEDHSLV
jgi:hypothetical protein